MGQTVGLPLPQIKTQPGTTLPVRLSTESFGFVGVVVVIVIVLGVVVSVAGCLCPVAIPFVLVAAVVLPFIPAIRRQLAAVRTASKSPLAVELDHHPAAPGQTLRGVLVIDKPLPLERLNVSVVCEEAATYRQGTDTHTDKRRTIEASILQLTDVPLPDRGPQQLPFVIEIPPTVMHSFHSPNNRIDWYIEVRRTFPGTAENCEQFRFAVLPDAVLEAMSRGDSLSGHPGGSEAQRLQELRAKYAMQSGNQQRGEKP